MSSVKLNGALPRGQANGLAALVDAPTEDPQRSHVVLIVVNTKSITTDIETGEISPTAQIRLIEPLLPEDLKTARRLMDRAMEQRTGLTMLPIDTENEINAAFRQARSDADD